MTLKRRHPQREAVDARLVPTKRRRVGAALDFISPLSDELLVRILTCLSLPHLLNVAPVSKRFHRLSEDSQIWKRLYYSKFVLPRALRIPGFRDGSVREGKLHYSSRKAVWADGRRGGWVDMLREGADPTSRDWKRQYKLRHNWSRGKCAVEELQVGETVNAAESSASPRMLVKVCEGIAVTAEATSGLRAWDLKTKALVAHISLSSGAGVSAPSCLAIDDQKLAQQQLDIAVCFTDGSFGVWELDSRKQNLIRRYRRPNSTNGRIIGAALRYPYLLTATESVLISLYTFDGASRSEGIGKQLDPRGDIEDDTDGELVNQADCHSEAEVAARHHRPSNLEQKSTDPSSKGDTLHAPYLLTSLKSQTSRAPLALSIRKTAGATVASIAYTFSTLQGWSLGIQDLHLRAPISALKSAPSITTTRLAYTLPFRNAPPRTSSPPRSQIHSDVTDATSLDGPTNICYTHPYLLATLPDNTLILYLCTSNATSLSISPGIRLWGHTSGISDAEITARGKAVSVSCRGEEIRVWELEGRADGRSVEIKAIASNGNEESDQDEGPGSGFDERRNWVGFDDEMVIVLKESREGNESLLVYDFT